MQLQDLRVTLKQREDDVTAAATIPRVLIIAGSDSGGGAGIQADLKTVSALGAFGMTAITALTAQNTREVAAVFEIAPEFVVRQIEACLDDIGCDALKTGMLVNSAMVEAVAGAIIACSAPLVIDPVMIAKHGTPLLSTQAVAKLKTKLLPLATVITPNLPEAAALSGRQVKTVSQMKDAARAIQDLGPRNVVIKGGHLESIATDLLYDGRDFTVLEGDRIESRNTHGTGCVFASAIAANLAHKKTVLESVVAAKEFVTSAIRGGLAIGSGHGPVDPMTMLYRDPYE